MTQSRTNNKVLISIIVLLLLTNVAMVSYVLFLGNKSPRKRTENKDGFSAVLRKEVGFTDEQVAKFNELKKTHWADAKMGLEQVTAIKNTLLDLVKTQDTVDEKVTTLIDSIANLQRKVEINAFKHVVATRKICTDDQKNAYDLLMKKIVNRGKGRNAEKKSPPENH